MFTPTHLEDIQFEKSMVGGYKTSAVDEVLAPLIDDYTVLYNENMMLKNKLRTLVKKVKDQMDSINESNRILEDARRTSEEIIAAAHAEAAKILAEAELIRAEAMGNVAAQKAEAEEAAKRQITGKGSVDRPWRKFYPQGIEQMMSIPRIPLYDYMKTMCRGMDLPVIHYYGTEITWDTYFNMVDDTARAMRAAGLGEGDQIPVLLRAVPEFLVILLAAEKIGASLLCRDNTIEENAEAISKAGAKILFAHDFITRKEVRAYADAGVRKIVLINPWKRAVKDQMPQHVVNCLSTCYTEPRVAGEYVCTWTEFISAGRIFVGRVEANKDIERPLFRAYTSGSTGPSKQVIHSAHSMLGVIHQMSGYGNSDDFRPTWLVTILPPALIAVTVSMMLVPMCSNRLLILDPFVDVYDIDLEMMRYKPNAWPLIPMFMEILMKSKRIPEDYDMSHMLACGAGAEATNNGQIRRAQEFLHKHNCHVVFSTSYGQSEACSNITFPAPGYEFGNGNVGIPMPLNVMGIFRGEKECDYYQKGEICISGPGTMLGYDNEEATSRTLIRHQDGLLWLHTGDTGYMNEDGVVYALGRGLAKRYDPENPDEGNRLVEIPMENQLCDAQVPGIVDAFFVNIPDKQHEGFYVPYLYAVLADGYTVESIQEGVHEALEPFQYPVEIIQIPERPFYHFKTNRLHLDAPYARR